MSCGIMAEVNRNINILDWFCRNLLRFKEACCGADWEHDMSCDDDRAKKMLTHG